MSHCHFYNIFEVNIPEECTNEFLIIIHIFKIFLKIEILLFKQTQMIWLIIVKIKLRTKKILHIIIRSIQQAVHKDQVAVTTI